MQLSVCVGAHGGKHTVMHINLFFWVSGFIHIWQIYDPPLYNAFEAYKMWQLLMVSTSGLEWLVQI